MEILNRRSEVVLPLWVVTNVLFETNFEIPDDLNRNVCCPFHGDDTPSMRLYNDGLGYCFGCGKQYSGFDAILFYTGGDYKEAYSILKSVFNIESLKKNAVDVGDSELVSFTKSFLSENDMSEVPNRYKFVRELTRRYLVERSKLNDRK